MGQVTLENVNDVITYHKPSDEGVEQISRIRAAAENLIRVVLENTPACADQSAAVRKVREAMMTSNASIVLAGII